MKTNIPPEDCNDDDVSRAHIQVGMVITSIVATQKILASFADINHIYVPSELSEIHASCDFLVITQGKKSAQTAVKRGIPCVALAAVTQWTKKPTKFADQDENTPVHPELARLSAGKKCLILFPEMNKATGVTGRLAASRLRDALLSQVTHWCRSEPIPKFPNADSECISIENLLVTNEGYDTLKKHIQTNTEKASQWMRPLFKLPYGYSTDLKRALHYLVMRNGKFDINNRNLVLREATTIDPNDGSVKIKYETVANTRAWVSHIVTSSDGDNQVRYGLTYVPLSEETPQTIYGDASILSLRADPDILAEHGARIQSCHRRAMEEFFHDCQSHGVKAGVVRSVPGTKARGWRDPDTFYPESIFVLPSRLITPDAEILPSDPACPLIPVETEIDESAAKSMSARGNAKVWLRAIFKSALQPAGLPAVIFAASASGLLRRWTPQSENFILHIYGESSAGKSLALKTAASFWGQPCIGGVVDAWRTTDNGLERKAALRNDAALFLDESGMVTDDSVIPKAVYMLGNGAEKSRAKKDGGVRQTTSYRLVTVSTGEKKAYRFQ